MRLTQLIAAWDILHLKDTGEMGFCDLDKALTDSGVVIENDAAGLMSGSDKTGDKHCPHTKWTPVLQCECGEIGSVLPDPQP